MPLTDIFIRNLKPTAKAEKFADVNGRYLYMSAKGGNSFVWTTAFKESEKH